MAVRLAFGGLCWKVGCRQVVGGGAKRCFRCDGPVGRDRVRRRGARRAFTGRRLSDWKGAPRGYSRRSRHTRATFDEFPDELDDVDVQVRVTEAWLAALKERRYVEEFDADAEDDGGAALIQNIRGRLRRMSLRHRQLGVRRH